jgi:Ca2+-binding EF-hand superfamily protein
LQYLSSKSAANVNIFDRAESLRHAFQLVDSQQKGYITAQDLVDLSQSINNDNDNAADDDDNALTEQQAQRIIHYSNHQSQSKGNHNNNKQEEAGYLQPSDFYRLFTPSDP